MLATGYILISLLNGTPQPDKWYARKDVCEKVAAFYVQSGMKAECVNNMAIGRE